jgi:hypothetical protein
LVHFKSKTLDKITYLVNDSFDTEKAQNLAMRISFHQQDQTSMREKHYVKHTLLFLGLCTKLLLRTCNTMGSTSMTDMDASTTADTFITARYAELVVKTHVFKTGLHDFYR